MRNTAIHVYIHFIWTTWNRSPLILPELRDPIYACIIAKCEAMGCVALAVGGIEDHVHVLARIPATVSIADLAQAMKGASSHLVAHKLGEKYEFKWQRGYGALSVSISHVRRVMKYIREQESHHAQNRVWSHLESVQSDTSAVPSDHQDCARRTGQ